ncbi:unnamed protein product [Amoebophrya sp. A25]|nr:unnamed protein product [Amoebophrya sp. A25]|eukprot:GSA25T00012979001.1
MAEEEALPEPNVVASSSSLVKAPQGIIWALMKDYASTPKLYDPSTLAEKCLSRDRLTKKPDAKQTRFSKPACVVEVKVEYDEPVEEEAPAVPPVEGEEAPPAEEGEEAAEPAPPAPPEKWVRCEVRFSVSQIGLTAAEMSAGTGTMCLRCTQKVGSTDCEVTAGVSVYSEALADTPPDFAAWASTLAGNLKTYSEKMVYLAPNVVKTKDEVFLHKMLAKAKGFKWIDLALSRSPSALELLESGEIGGSLGFYKDQKDISPISRN